LIDRAGIDDNSVRPTRAVTLDLVVENEQRGADHQEVDEWLFEPSHYFGEYQIGDVYARSWVVIGTSADIVTP
jgi:hypothetical protein